MSRGWDRKRTEKAGAAMAWPVMALVLLTVVVLVLDWLGAI